MNSDKSEEDEHEVISKQIVDYYRKYSQNQQLPKYFTGTSLSYVPPIVKDEELITKSGSAITPDETDSKTVTEQPVIQVDEQTEQKAVSPTSSVTSNRKLEWDNGADIGYSNCHANVKLHKSLSLPVLLGSQIKPTEKNSKHKFTSQITTVVSYPGQDDDIEYKLIQSSSSSPSVAQEAPIESSSSSFIPSKKTSSSSSSFSNTIAYLKSKIGFPDAESTPKLSSVPIYVDTPHVPKLGKGKMEIKNVNLCITKPILIQCLHNQKKGFNKRIQTSFVECESKCIQTGASLEMVKEKSESPIQNPTENQSVIIIDYDCESDRRTCSSNTQTDPEIIVSNSFEYYKNNYEEPKGDSQDSPGTDFAFSTDSSKDIPLLGQLISQKQSKSVIADVDRSIELLQKLLKSKKYDDATKKRYIKKIVDKIVNGKYNEDSTSSSELFIPKKPTDEVVDQKLEENIPWQPTALSKFTVKTFSEEFLPSETCTETKKKSIFTVSQQRDQPSTSTNSSLEKQNVSSDSYKNWKENKTQSEHLWEQKQKGQGDELVKFAMKERQHQISWIKDEISHLTKLKGLLEKKIRTTTVYMLSDQSLHSCNSSCTCPHSKSSQKNYVIQTELSSSSTDVPKYYNLYENSGRKTYRVTELSAKQEETDINKKVVGDIKVVSDENTTNIQVKTTFNKDGTEQFAPKAPTLVGVGKYGTFPKSRTEIARCWPCGRPQLSRNFPEKKDTKDARKYSFEIPLNSETNFPSKARSILDKFTSLEQSYKKFTACQCGCKCTDITRNENRISKYKDLPYIQNDTSKKPSEVKEQHSSKYKYTGLSQKDIAVSVCTCCKSIPSVDKENVLSQTVDCHCCNKPTQTSSDCICFKREASTEDKVDKENVVCQTVGCQCSNKQIQTSSSDCICCRRGTSTEDKVDKENALCQTVGCQCSNKQIQTSSSDCICSKREASTEDKVDKENVLCQTAGCQCCNKQMQTSQVEMADKYEEIQTSTSTKCRCTDEGSESTQTTSSTYSVSLSFESETCTATETVRSCICCKRKNVKSKYLYSLRKKLSDQAYPLCRPCYRQNRRGAYGENYYTNPGHVCNCYTVVETKTLDEIKKTINDLNELDQYCTCINADNRSSSDYCKYCKCKLRKTSKSKNGIAYTLTFENAPIQMEKKRRKRTPRLEEIKIKIPVSQKKKHKDKENKRKKTKHRSDDSEDASTSGNRRNNGQTLQEYLSKNRPGFVEHAEGRRKTVNEAKINREEMSDYNKLQFLQKCKEECDKNAKRLFSAKEMKEITKRNYKRLPEVQQRLNENRDRQLRQASRLMADTFNKKLRENVLKGKRNLPTDVKIVNI